jgi:DNA repair protein RadC
MLQQWDSNKIDLIEQFKVILLSWNSKVLGVYEVSAGNMHATVVDIKLIMAAALKGRAASIILAHNHPSGEPLPSFADQALTDKIKKMAKVLDIRITDHIILCRDCYFSFADEGLLKPG